MLLLTEHDESLFPESLRMPEYKMLHVICWQIDWLALGGPSVYPVGPHRLVTVFRSATRGRVLVRGMIEVSGMENEKNELQKAFTNLIIEERKLYCIELGVNLINGFCLQVGRVMI